MIGTFLKGREADKDMRFISYETYRDHERNQEKKDSASMFGLFKKRSGSSVPVTSVRKPRTKAGHLVGHTSKKSIGVDPLSVDILSSSVDFQQDFDSASQQLKSQDRFDLSGEVSKPQRDIDLSWLNSENASEDFDLDDLYKDETISRRVGLFCLPSDYENYLKDTLSELGVDVHLVTGLEDLNQTSLDEASHWIMVLSDKINDSVLDKLVDRYIDKPSLFLCSSVSKQKAYEKLKEFMV